MQYDVKRQVACTSVYFFFLQKNSWLQIASQSGKERIVEVCLKNLIDANSTDLAIAWDDPGCKVPYNPYITLLP